jgi:predicted metal-dependent enzyme (double-stranded beta helix superfamily)
MSRLVSFQRFVEDLHRVWASTVDTEERMRAAKPIVERFVLEPELQSASRDWPSTEPRKNLLFHEDPDFGFAINGVVRSPNYRGGVHDHAHAWVLYGVIEGSESLERFERLDDGLQPGYAELRKSYTTLGTPGRVDLVPAFSIHAEQGGPSRSTALILRSERVAGRVLQNSYDPARNTVNEREGPEQIPYPL